MTTCIKGGTQTRRCRLYHPLFPRQSILGLSKHSPKERINTRHQPQRTVPEVGPGSRAHRGAASGSAQQAPIQTSGLLPALCGTQGWCLWDRLHCVAGNKASCHSHSPCRLPTPTTPSWGFGWLLSHAHSVFVGLLARVRGAAWAELIISGPQATH